MKKTNNLASTSLTTLLWVCSVAFYPNSVNAAEDDKPAPLPVDAPQQVNVLPVDYPGSWLFAHDANFQSLVAGKVVLIDAAADTKEYKGAIGAGLFATFIQSEHRPELYVGETFYSRGTRGIRTDIVSIYDKSTFHKTGEILLPNNNRAQTVTNKFSMQLVDNDRFLLIFNFTPASSVTIIDTESKTLVNEIAIPGCSMVYPTGLRGFSSLCGDGSMMTVQFSEEGQEINRTTIAPFFSVDDDPLFDKPIYIGETAYFVSYKGRVVPVDMSGVVPEVGQSWSMLTETETVQNWRPSGWQIVTGNESELYVIMSKNGFDGSHKSGGEQIWIFDINTQQKSREIIPQTSAFSVQYLDAEVALLAVTNVDMGLDIYSMSGVLQRSISVGDSAMPFILHASK